VVNFSLQRKYVGCRAGCFKKLLSITSHITRFPAMTRDTEFTLFEPERIPCLKFVESRVKWQ
jgi:hypothetical protein